MNIATMNRKTGAFYIACIRLEKGLYCAMGKLVRPNGELIGYGEKFLFPTKCEAERKCRQLAKMKVRKRGYEDVPSGSLPAGVQKHLEIPLGTRVTTEEMVDIVTKAQSERYVVFRDVDGIEEHFDAGVEYLGYEVEGEQEFMDVHDKFGKLKSCFVSRMESVCPTERCLEAAGGQNG